MIKTRLKHAEAVAVARKDNTVDGRFTAAEIDQIREVNEGDKLGQIPPDKRTPEQAARLAELETKYKCDFVEVRARLDALVA